MCGVAGIYAYSPDAKPIDVVELTRIRDRMYRRGPDGAGMWIAPDKKIGLAHRRLSVIELTEAGSQPMVDPYTGNQIVFNGEIYNFQALKAELESDGRTFRSNSDTEVLLALYAVHGLDMIHRLRGMYAFALWDAHDQTLIMARDPLGIKPLYFADDGKTIRFASQVKALLMGGAIDPAPEPAGHVGFLLWGNVPEPYTLYKHVRALPAGHFMRVGRGFSSAPSCFDSLTKRFAEASKDQRFMPDEDAISFVSDAIQQSIESHLLADVPVGVFLSSGLDSALIAAVASHKCEIQAITLGFQEYRGTLNDEVPTAKKLAQHLNIPHTSVRITAADFFGDYKDYLDCMDQPTIDGLNTWFVAKAAASLGLKVGVSGLGGDELLGSYPSFKQVPTLHRFVSGTPGLSRMGKVFRMSTAPILKNFTSSKYAGLLEYGNSLGGAYLLRRSLYMPWELPEIIGTDMARSGWQQLNALSNLAGTHEGIDSSRLAISALEMTHYMRNQLLRDADWAGMAHSVEIRVPFADFQLVTATAAIFAAAPHIAKSEVAGRVANQLPAKLLRRNKTGFSVPIKSWKKPNSLLPQRGLRDWANTVYAAIIEK